MNSTASPLLHLHIYRECELTAGLSSACTKYLLHGGFGSLLKPNCLLAIGTKLVWSAPVHVAHAQLDPWNRPTVLVTMLTYTIVGAGLYPLNRLPSLKAALRMLSQAINV